MNDDGISLNNVAHPKGSWWSSVKLWLRGSRFSKGSTVTVDASDLVTPARPSYTHTTTKYAGVLNGCRYPYLYIHREGCGRPAWYHASKPKDGEFNLLSHHGVMTLEGGCMDMQPILRCGSCHAVMSGELHTDNIVDTETWALTQRLND